STKIRTRKESRFSSHPAKVRMSIGLHNPGVALAIARLTPPNFRHASGVRSPHTPCTTFHGFITCSLVNSAKPGASMKSKLASAIVCLIGVSALLFSQTPKETTAAAIPGVIAAGAKVQLIWQGFEGADGIVG